MSKFEFRVPEETQLNVFFLFCIVFNMFIQTRLHYLWTFLFLVWLMCNNVDLEEYLLI